MSHPSRLQRGAERGGETRRALLPQQLSRSHSYSHSITTTPGLSPHQSHPPPHLPSPSRTRQFFSTPPSPSTSTPMQPPTTTTTTTNPNTTAAAAAAAAPTTTTTAAASAAAATTAHEKMWHEMQQKLEEVSLSGDHVFGSTHSKSLADLRTAQVELAQAWMRSEEDDLDNKHTVFGRQAFAPAASGAGVGASSSVATVQEQDEDLLLAGERRRANDAHFARVAMSVVDVTRRLENVARAMAGVELESRGIWAGSSDSDGSSLLG